MTNEQPRRRHRAGAGRKPGGSAAMVLEFLGEAQPPGAVTALKVAEVISQRFEEYRRQIEQLRQANALICSQRDAALERCHKSPGKPCRCPASKQRTES